MIAAIVGRPNVGKSTIFNRIVGKRVSIVHHKSGVTRDRVFAYGEWQGKMFGLFDTGGFWPEEEILFREINDQIKLAIEDSDLILFVVDGKSGIIPLDEELYRMIRKVGKKIILIVNKIDNFNDPPEAVYNIPFPERPFLVSAAQGHGLAEVLDEIITHIEGSDQKKEDGDNVRLLILGRPNVGKSTLLNQLTGKKRAVVEPSPGTTRDPLSEHLNYKSRSIELIDTAGLRRKSKVKEDIEFYSVLRALRMIPTADLAMLLFDAVEGPVKQDFRISDLVLMRGKGIVLVPNKIDLLDQQEPAVLIEATQKMFYFIPNCPVVPISAMEGINLELLLDRCLDVYSQGRKKIDDEVFKDIIADMPPPPGRNRILGIKQLGIAPPVFEVRVRNKLPTNYLRFVKRKLRQYFSFAGQPIIVKVRCRT